MHDQARRSSSTIGPCSAPPWSRWAKRESASPIPLKTPLSTRRKRPALTSAALGAATWNRTPAAQRGAELVEHHPWKSHVEPRCRIHAEQLVGTPRPLARQGLHPTSDRVHGLRALRERRRGQGVDRALDLLERRDPWRLGSALPRRR